MTYREMGYYSNGSERNRNGKGGINWVIQLKIGTNDELL
jgi:hypothetical protein